MKPFDPGGAPCALADGLSTAPFGEFGLAQVGPRREFFCSRGLKEGICLEHAEKRVLHSTYRATLHLTASPAILPDPSKVADLPSVLKNAEGPAHSSSDLRASDGSIRFPENLGSSMEGKGRTSMDCVSRVHNTNKRIMDCGHVQQEQENSSHVSGSFDGSLMLNNHPGVSSSCFSKSLQNNYHPTSSKFTSLEALQIPRASALHISCDEMQRENEFCLEDPEAPSTPDLQPEARSWDREAHCTTAVDHMPPTYNICATGANDMASGGSPCSKDTDDTEEDCCIYVMGRTEQSANSQTSSKILNYSAHRQYIVQWLFSCLMMISAQSICATPNNMKSPLLHSSWSLQRLMVFLKWEGLDCKGDAILQQLLADIQNFSQVHQPRLFPDHDQKAMEASRAACYSEQLACKQEHAMVTEYAGRNGHHQKVGMEMIVQGQVLVLHQVFLRRHLDRRSGNRFLLRCLYLEQDIKRNCEFRQCSSIFSSKVHIVSVSTSPNLLETENVRLAAMMHDFEESVAESHGSVSWSQENDLIRVVEEADDLNSIPIEQVGECLNTCGLHLQAHPSAFTSEIAELFGHSVIRNQSGTLNMRRSNVSIIDEGQQDHIVCVKDDRHQGSCLPMSTGDGCYSLTLPQSNMYLGFNVEESKSCMPHGWVHEKQSREKLEQFAEVFLLRRHIIQQQRRAQQAPPYPCREFSRLAAADKCSLSTGLLAGGPYTSSYMNTSTKCSENRDREPGMIHTSSVTKPCDVTSSFCDHDDFVGADIVIDIVGLVKYLEGQSSQSETLTDAAADLIGCTTHMPFTNGQLVVPNMNAMIVTIVAIVFYTKILLKGALAWVGSGNQSEEEKS